MSAKLRIWVLVLVTVCLQVPAGASLRVCLCGLESLFAPEVAACCAPVDRTSCCATAAEREHGAQLRRDDTCHGSERCGCHELRAPERDGRIDVDELLSLVDDRTRVIAISWVEFATGFRFDLERIGRFCRERDILFVVDAIQGLGALPINVERMHVDVLASSAHKWLLGSEGIAIVYISDRVVEQIRPLRTGWTAIENWMKWSRYELTPRPGAERHEIGTLNPFGIAALGASLEILLEAGIDRISAHCRELTDQLVDGLAATGCRIVSSRAEGEWSPIVTFTHHAATPPAIVDHLASRNISVAHRSGRVRIAPHFYNTHDEVAQLLDAL